MTTIKTIAERVGKDIATVSRALNNLPGVRRGNAGTDKEGSSGVGLSQAQCRPESGTAKDQ